jgi:hypothetical protein
VAGLDWLVFKHVERRALQVSSTARGKERVLVNDRAAGHINEEGGRAAVCEPGSVNEVIRLRSQGTGNTHEVRLAQQYVEVDCLHLLIAETDQPQSASTESHTHVVKFVGPAPRTSQLVLEQ